MKFSSAYLLVSHGSRDPRPQIAVDYLANLVAQQVSSGVSASKRSSEGTVGGTVLPLVGTAVLESSPLPLHQQIQLFGKRAHAAGYRYLQLLPLFLLAGVHVMEDLPAEVAIAAQTLDSPIAVELRPHLGSHPLLRDLLINPFHPSVAVAGRVLLAHGSRRPEGNQAVEAIAAHLQALPAYWSRSPTLEEQVTELVKQGDQQIAILPYFLFEGGITDAIAQQVHRLAQQHPEVQFHLARPIGATPALADLIVDLLE